MDSKECDEKKKRRAKYFWLIFISARMNFIFSNPVHHINPLYFVMHASERARYGWMWYALIFDSQPIFILADSPDSAWRKKTVYYNIHKNVQIFIYESNIKTTTTTHHRQQPASQPANTGSMHVNLLWTNFFFICFWLSLCCLLFTLNIFLPLAGAVGGGGGGGDTAAIWHSHYISSTKSFMLLSSYCLASHKNRSKSAPLLATEKFNIFFVVVCCDNFYFRFI